MEKQNIAATVDPLWWKLLNAGWFSLAVGTVIGLVGLYAAYYTYVRTRLRPSVLVTADSSLIVGPVKNIGVGELQILYNGANVPQVTSSIIGLWNDGTTIFRNTDIVESDFIRATIDNGKILHASIESSSRDVIGPSVLIVDECTAKISFSFLEPGDAMVIRILHTGLGNQVSVRGTIIGLPQGLKDFHVIRPKGFIRKNADNFALGAFGVFLLVLTAVIWSKAGWQKGILLPVGLAGFVATVTALIMIAEKVGARWKSKLPKTILNNSRLRRTLELQKLLNRV